MKTIISSVVLFASLLACSTQQNSIASSEQKSGAKTVVSKGDTIRIVNDSLEYEVIIIDPGFNNWMNMNARPRGYYSQSYLEQHNIPWVTQFNINTRSPLGNRNADLYQLEIDYRGSINYGYEVNYLLFNYLNYFQLSNKVRLGGPIPRI
ncbi:DUF6146 family protein [Flavobacterium sp.]|uniref:DUF6146 family protein n=1 Tax=Flavobacterium sp. TaxID=239 RepID=UPI00121ED8AC|nr:DUF6146 family protein [Flavobacterium sp.]RZJ72298.1 MAG: hypothetical protein EOO49_07550 [Flavobacterium sp.]